MPEMDLSILDPASVPALGAGLGLEPVDGGAFVVAAGAGLRGILYPFAVLAFWTITGSSLRLALRPANAPGFKSFGLAMVPPMPGSRVREPLAREGGGADLSAEAAGFLDPWLDFLVVPATPEGFFLVRAFVCPGRSLPGAAFLIAAIRLRYASSKVSARFSAFCHDLVACADLTRAASSFLEPANFAAFPLLAKIKREIKRLSASSLLALLAATCFLLATFLLTSRATLRRSVIGPLLRFRLICFKGLASTDFGAFRGFPITPFLPPAIRVCAATFAALRPRLPRVTAPFCALAERDVDSLWSAGSLARSLALLAFSDVLAPRVEARPD
jgi:hypothetical protein